MTNYPLNSGMGNHDAVGILVECTLVVLLEGVQQFDAFCKMFFFFHLCFQSLVCRLSRLESELTTMQLFAMLCLLGAALIGTIAANPHLNVTATTPAVLWERSPAVASLTPDAPSLVLGDNGQVVVEFRKNSTTNEFYVRAVNASTGNVLWTKMSTDLCSAIQFIDDAGDNTHFLVGCTDHFLIFTVSSGLLATRVDLPQKTYLQALSAPVTDQSYSAFSVISGKFIIFSAVSQPGGSSGNSTFGTLLFDISQAILTNTSLLDTCPLNVPLASIITGAGEQGFAMVCNEAQVSYVSFSSKTRVWRNFNSDGTAYVAGSFANGASLANVALSFKQGGAAHIVAFDVLSSHGMPMWSKTLPELGRAVSSAGETVIVVTTAFALALQGDNGVQMWNRSNFDTLQAVVFVDLLIGGSVFLLDYTYIYQVDLMTGGIISSIDPEFDAVSPAFGLAVPIRQYLAPLNSNEITISGAEYFMGFGTYGGLVLWNCSASGCSSAIQIEGGTVISPLKIAQVYSASQEENGLLVQTTSGLTMYSLTTGWTVQQAYWVGTQDGVAFVNTQDNGNAAALDRNGATVWIAPAPFLSFSEYPIPFMSNILFDMIEESTIVAINTYNGSTVQTLRLDSDCFSNASMVPDSLLAIVPDSTNSNAYFTASLQCLFRIESDLSLHTIPLPLRATTAPVVDDDNGLAYILTTHQILTVSIPLGLTTRILFTSEFGVSAVYPSSAWSDPQNLRRGLNRLIYVATSRAIHALDVVDHGNTMIWTLEAQQPSSLTFYNNNMYFFSPNMGVCSASLNVSLSPSQRLNWCAGKSQLNSNDNYEVSILVLPDGVLVAILGDVLLAVDASTGRPRWSLSGFIQLSPNSYDSCSSMVFDPDHYILFVSCNAFGVALDALHSGHLLYTIADAFDSILTYFGGVMFAASIGSSGVSGFPIPPMFSNRRQVPTPLPTSAAMVETLPPNFIPLPQPEPTAGPFPNGGSAYSEVYPSMFSRNTISDYGYNVGSGSAVAGGSLFPGIVFMTPRERDGGSVVIEAFNVTSGSYFWRVTGSAQTCSQSFVCGTSIATAVFVYLCGEETFAYDASTGAALWKNSSAALIAAWTPSMGGGDCVVLAVGNTSTTGLDGRTGNPLFDVPHDSIIEDSALLETRMFYPSGKNIAFLALVGFGAQFIQLGPNRSQASISYTVAPGNGNTTPDRFCSENQTFTVAGPANGGRADGDFVNSEYAYFSCESLSGQAQFVAVFRVNLLLSSITVLQNVSIGDSDQIRVMLVEQLQGEAPQIYLSLSASIYKIDGITGHLGWDVPGQFYFTLGVSVDLVWVSAYSESYDSQLFAAFNKTSGTYLWNISVGVIQSTPPIPRISTVDLQKGMVLVGNVGVYAVEYTADAATILWATASADAGGWVRSIEVAPSATFLSVPNGPATASPMMEATITFYSSTATYLHTSLFSLGDSIVPIDTQFADAFVAPTRAPNGNPFYFLAASYDNSEIVGAFPQGWTMLVQTSIGFGSGLIAGIPPVPVSVVFSSVYVAVVHQQTGQRLGLYYFSDACVSSQGISAQESSTHKILGASVYFSDAYCVYRIDIVNRQMSAVLLSPAGNLITGTTDHLISTSDNTSLFLYTSAGAVFNVAIPSLTINWINDALQFVALESLSSLLLPMYDATIPHFNQQLIGVASTGVVSFSVGTGQVAWVYFFEGTLGVHSSPDGNLIHVWDGGITKLNMSTAVRDASVRPIWTLPTGGANYESTACTGVIPHTNVFLVFPTQFLIAVDLSNGSVIWNSTATDGDDYSSYCDALVPILDPRAPSNEPPPVIAVLNEEADLTFISSATGEQLFYFDTSVYAGNFVANDGWMSAFSDDLLQSMPYPVMASPPATGSLPPPVALPTPIIPNGYIFPPPDVNSSSAKMAPHAPPFPLRLWSSDFKIPASSTLQSGSFVSSEIQGVDVIVQAVTYYHYSQSQGNYIYAASMVVINALYGNVISTKPLPFCQVDWMLLLSSRVAAVKCESTVSSRNSSLLLIDVTTASLTVLATLQPPDFFFTYSGNELPTVLQLPDFDIACVYIAHDFPMICLGTNPLNQSSFGRVVHSQNCPSKFTSVPTYDAAHQLLLYGCRDKRAAPGSNAVIAASAETGKIVWNTTTEEAEVDQVAYSNNFGVALLTGQLPNITHGNFTIQAFSLATGAMVTTMYDPFPDQKSTDIHAIYALELSISPLDLMVIFVTFSKTVGFSTHAARIIWDVYTGIASGGNYDSVASLMAVDPVRSNAPTLYVSVVGYESVNLHAIDPLASFNNELYALTALQQSDSEATTLQLVSSGATLALVIGLYYSFLYVDLVSRKFQFVYDDSYENALQIFLYNRLAPVTGTPQLVLNYGSNGNLHQFLVNTTGALALSAALQPVTLQLAAGGTAAQYLVGSSGGGATFLLNATGSVLWGTETPIYGSFTEAHPLLLQINSTSTVLIVRFAVRAFNVFDPESGTVLYSGHLPLCEGEGFDAAGSAPLQTGGAVADLANGLVYFSVQNQCLYALDLHKRAISQHVVPSRIPLLGTIVKTQHCIVASDLFGGVVCFPLGPGLNTTPRWTFRLGYTPDVSGLELTSFGSLLLVNNGGELVCITEDAGLLVWRRSLGPRLTFTTFNRSTIVARTWLGVYTIDVDPSLQEAQRIQRFIGTDALFGGPYNGPQDGYTGNLIRPIVAANGQIIVVYATQVFGIDYHTGSIVFRFSTSVTITSVVYSIDSPPLNRVFFVASKNIDVHSVVDGAKLVALPSDSDDGGQVDLSILPVAQIIAFTTASDDNGQAGAAQIQPIPSFIDEMVKPFSQIVIDSPTMFSLPPGYSPQGGQTPLPTLAPDVTLPKLSCVLNIEALYEDLVTCVNGVVAHIYTNRSVNAIFCQDAAQRLATCTSEWVQNIVPSCPGASIYLDNILTKLNVSSTFNFCGESSRCADGSTGATAVCVVMNSARPLSGGVTFAPQLHLPKPLNELPSFTVPSNTVTYPPSTRPQTTLAPGTTTSAPGTKVPTSTTTLTPGTTTLPSTAIPTPTVTTHAPSTTFAPSQEFIFSCTLPFGHVTPDANFALLVGLQIGLTGAAPIAISQPIAAFKTQPTTPNSEAKETSSGAEFTFVFTGVDAAADSQSLFFQVQHNPTAVAQSLGLQAIYGSPYTPEPPLPKDGLSGGAVAGIVITAIVAIAGGAVAYRHFSRRGRSQSSRQAVLRGSMIQEEGGYGGTVSSDGTVLSKREMGDVKTNTTEGPIYSSM